MNGNWEKNGGRTNRESERGGVGEVLGILFRIDHGTLNSIFFYSWFLVLIMRVWFFGNVVGRADGAGMK
jgi:hypothetical protein